ncbi:hypothetical protein [Veillonella caviae]|uniref:hypothetical protein n=1 Tax=Veillonella caviae TaxID=248316 RepID=UPI002357D0EA|nr:hypothetical protein [Veillonella caviae]
MSETIFILMHKDIPVLRVLMSDRRTILKVLEIINREHLPVNMQGDEHIVASLYKFMTSRTIPNSRKNLPYILEMYDTVDAVSLSMFTYQVSMSDHYWFKPENANLTWANVNFYDNIFVDNLLFLGSLDSKGINFSSPNTSLNGSLPQMWSKRNGYNVLLKGGTVFNQQPFNEVFVSRLLDATDIPHVQYDLVYDNAAGWVSACNAFTNESIEFVPAWMIGDSGNPKANRYEVFVQRAESMGIKEARAFINAMLAIDYLTVNDDRHYGNFGFLRNSDTLQYIGMAPIFDNGNTFGYLDGRIKPHMPSYAYKSQPFSTTHDKQIKYIRTLLPTIDIDRLAHIGHHILEDVYNKNDMLSPERITAIGELLDTRMRQLKRVLE